MYLHVFQHLNQSFQNQYGVVSSTSCLTEKGKKGKFLPMRNSMLLHCGRRVVRAKQLLAWQKALGVRTLSSVTDVVKLALADGVAGGMHGKRRYPPRML
jgi:hypothetical protein